MRSLILVLTVLFCFQTMAQEKEYDVIEHAKAMGLDPAIVAEKVKESRAQLEEMVGEESENLVPVGLGFQKVQEENAVLNSLELNCADCMINSTLTENSINTLSTSLNNVTQTTEEQAKGPKGVLFITWGYNRGFHSKSDINVETPNGTITIKDAVGNDRPSPLSLEYLKPSKFSVPQYNFKLGYWFSKDSKFGIAIGTDHMKWVFDADQEYQIEGDYTGDLWVKGQKKSFEEIKAGTDASFLLLEHTDGYNYPFVEGLYREKLINTKRFGLDLEFGLGVGILFPKTRTRIADQIDTAAYRDVDNKFKVAGWAASAGVTITMEYRLKNGITYYVSPGFKFVAGKINNALFLGNDTGRISQSMIYTKEYTLSLGSKIPTYLIGNLFKKKENRK